MEEYHRGEWIPLQSTDEKGQKLGQKIVKISDETAETLNLDAKLTKIRYVLSDGGKKSDKKDPFRGSKQEQEEMAKELGVEFSDEHSNQEKRAAFLKTVSESK